LHTGLQQSVQTMPWHTGNTGHALYTDCYSVTNTNPNPYLGANPG